MTHTCGYVRKSLAHSGRRIASARASFGLISAGGVSNCNYGTRENGLFQHFSRDTAAQFLSLFLN